MNVLRKEDDEVEKCQQKQIEKKKRFYAVDQISKNTSAETETKI